VDDDEGDDDDDGVADPSPNSANPMLGGSARNTEYTFLERGTAQTRNVSPIIHLWIPDRPPDAASLAFRSNIAPMQILGEFVNSNISSSAIGHDRPPNAIDILSCVVHAIYHHTHTYVRLT
jgi:hypothetical protein